MSSGQDASSSIPSPFSGSHRLPIPVKYVKDGLENHNGEVRITVPADPEKLKAYRASPEGKKYNTKQFGRNL